MNPPAGPAVAGRWLVLCAVAASLGGCISGRVLEGYPGYPFLSFTVPVPADSSFFDLQDALRAEGFEIDFTERDSGLINTRPAVRAPGEMFLTVVLAAAPDDEYGPGTTRAWVAGYEPVRDGAERINPLAEESWAELLGVAAALSERLGGTPPEAPDPPAD